MTELRSLTDPYLRKKIMTQPHTAILPVGSIEQHGPHLPLSTDSDIVTEIAKRIAKKTKFLVLPTLNYGVSIEHFPFFNLSIKKITLQKVILELCLSLQQNQIKNILVLNGHHGNLESIKNLQKKIHDSLQHGVKVLVFSYWQFMEKKLDHAGFVETSIMLAISKSVLMQKASKGFDPEKLSAKQKLAANKLASKSFISVTGNGVWGDPRLANADEGTKILKEIVTNFLKKSNLPY